jgi:hypothetical protein
MKIFKCGCCGSGFESKKQDQDQDKGFGICPRCSELNKKENELEWQKIEQKVGSSLNFKNRKKFWEMEKEVRRGLILQMIEEEVICFSIKRSS